VGLGAKRTRRGDVNAGDEILMTIVPFLKIQMKHNGQRCPIFDSGANGLTKILNFSGD
jgi:hypothetical protein